MVKRLRRNPKFVGTESKVRKSFLACKAADEESISARMDAFLGAQAPGATLFFASLCVMMARELRDKGVFFLPGVGAFSVTTVPAKEGKMMMVGGAPKAVRPKPEKKEIAFQPFDDFMELFALSSMSPDRRAEKAADIMDAVGGAASSSSSGQHVPSVSSRAPRKWIWDFGRDGPLHRKLPAEVGASALSFSCGVPRQRPA